MEGIGMRKKWERRIKREKGGEGVKDGRQKIRLWHAEEKSCIVR